jgi:hypothetical protein
MRHNGNVAYLTKQLEPYMGAKIVGFADDEEGVFGLIIQKGKQKKVLWVLCDPEGNGPGFLELGDAE